MMHIDNPTSLPITVDYSKSLAEMIEASHCHAVSKQIRERNLPPRPIERKVVKYLAEVVRFKSPILEKDMSTELNTANLRPATIEELLAFGTAYQVCHLKYGGLTALGSIVKDKYQPPKVICLRQGGEGRDGFATRRLEAKPLDYEEWSRLRRYLAIRR